MNTACPLSCFERPWRAQEHQGPHAVFRTIRRCRKGGVVERVITVIDDIAWQELRLLLRRPG